MRQSTVVPKRDMKVRIPAHAGLARFFLGGFGRILMLAAALLVIAAVAIFSYSYNKYTSVVAEKLRGPFANSAKIFAAPEAVAVGDASSPEEIAADSAPQRLHGITHSNHNGYYQRRPNSIEIFPGPLSYFDQEAATIKFSNGRFSEVVSLQDNTSRPEYQLEPQLITNVAGPSREKRRTVRSSRDIPTVLVRSHHFGRGQALLPTPRLRRGAREGEGGVCRFEAKAARTRARSTRLPCSWRA